MSDRARRIRRPILRQDYRPPAWLIEHVDLTFALDPDTTRVRAHLDVKRNPACPDRKQPLTLHGVDLKTQRVEIDGRPIEARQKSHQDEALVIAQMPDRARLSTEVLIHPRANSALEGLYASGHTLLTQCEAEGFRKITWFIDRPDVMCTYRVRLEGDRKRFPILLSNGNLHSCGDLDDGRHFAVWDDPFPKSSYLFALVAGNLGSRSDRFTTASGRTVALEIYSEEDNLGRLDHAMASLKRAMAWDEQRWGLEYDLDIYHIVATHDFNMGAMENKSLNIFNARYVLADGKTATDEDFLAVESVIGHEYFHNWSGNRVTCRDWFQLTLKEGLTVFRDQEFTADLHSRPVKRITDVRNLLARQVPEDEGPMAHPIRPERYVEINNFYTATVYEKGAEVVRMLQTILGCEGFRRGLDLYFRRHDGQAVTCDDFLAAMAEANGADLTQFSRWYAVVGTPRLRVERDYDDQRGELILRLHQSLPDHPDNDQRGPLMIPLRMGFLDARNEPLAVCMPGEPAPGVTCGMVVLTDVDTELRFPGLPADALPSLLRDFSAPVRLDMELSCTELARLAGHDPDPYKRWRAGRMLAEELLDQSLRVGQLPEAAGLLLQVWSAAIQQAAADPALIAECLTVPAAHELVQRYDPLDLDATLKAHVDLREYLSSQLAEPLWQLCLSMVDQSVWSAEPGSVARRRLKNTILDLLVRGGHLQALEQARRQAGSSDNMSDRFAGLRALAHAGDDFAGDLLDEFAERYRSHPEALDKWFAIQASIPESAAVEWVDALLGHGAFSLRNPNKVRALLGTFAQLNPAAFHRADGAGYRLLGRVIGLLDGLNPQVAARLVGAFNRWRCMDANRAGQMHAELEAIAARKGLSPDVEEVVLAALRSPARGAGQ